MCNSSYLVTSGISGLLLLMLATEVKSTDPSELYEKKEVKFQ